MRRNRLTLAASTAAISVLATACVGSTDTGATDDPAARSTLTFWHGWTATAEVKAIDENIARFEKKHPNITVKAISGINDEKLNQALRAGGSKGPDVVSSFTTANIGKFCSSGAFADLGPFIEKSKLDLEKTFSKPLLDYTQFEGKRYALPLLSDAYGLYYNKDAFKAAGIKKPPRTWEEFDRAAVALTESKGDTYEQLGFMPNYHGYETVPSHYISQWSPTYFTKDGRSNIAKDPSFKAMYSWQRALVHKLGGYAKLEKYQKTFGDEWGAKHPFHTGQVAMQLDGEWRLGMTEATDPGFEIGVAPLPVPKDQIDSYGKGYLSGTVLGIAPASEKQNAAWELVKYLTTDTEAVVQFANAIKNVPSTKAALKSPDLKFDPRFKTFLDIAQHPDSNTSDGAINGITYQMSLQNFGYQVENGAVRDIQAGLEKTAKEIDTDIAQAK